MGKKILLLLVVAVVAMVIVPATASAGLVNEYGMHFAGQQACVDCHAFFGGTTTNTTHSRMAKNGLIPDPPGAWTVFQSPGGVGEAFSIADNTWITLGDYQGGLATEYLYWEGTADPTVMPWNLVEGLAYETPESMWALADEGLEGLAYGCQRCHMLGTTVPATKGETVPREPVVTPSATTATQWARLDGTTVADFMSDPTVSYPGMSIQCEACHGTGQAATVEEGAHTNTGVKVSTALWGNTGMGQSQVCGQCHGSYANVAGTLGIYGYTANLPMRNFVDINGRDTAGRMYDYVPTDAQFMANPTMYYMFPNGSNARGNHYYYTEWAASAHSYRGAYYLPAPTPPAGEQTQPAANPADFNLDALVYQAGWGTPTPATAQNPNPDPDPTQGAWGKGHYNATAQSSIDSKCFKCHTGEGYLWSKGDKMAQTVDGTTTGPPFVPSTSNTGLMGQECATCHNAHPWAGGKDGVSHEGTIRAPDKAGERSAAGLQTGNSSVCEDCHNWQFEVQGTTPSYKPQADLNGRGGPSHPIRETYHGRVMLDIPPTDQSEPGVTDVVMPGVKCEDCHMPKTNRGANRFSHGMKIMLPGEAETWMTAAGPDYQGQDSCSKCHPTEGRERLQQYIDEWQGDAAAQAALTADAINAAYARASADMSNPSSPNYILVGRATWNYKSYKNDPSAGAHSPRYELRGLVKAEQMAKSVGGSFASLFWSNSVVPGGTGFVTGKVINGGIDKSGAAGASLALYKNGVATDMATIADAQGNFAFMITPAGSASYKVVWMRSGDAKSNLSSSSMTVAVAKMASKTTLATSATSILVNKSVKLSGKVTPAAVGQSVKIQYRRTTSASWRALSTVTLNATSHYAKTKKLTSKGTWYFRTLYSGTATVASSKSAAVKVIVK
jgi:Cytochrome c552